MKLLRNCSHGNDVATYYHATGGEEYIFKTSSTKAGLGQLRQELSGWEWYRSRRQPQSNDRFCEIVSEREEYLKIRIEYVHGDKAKYSDGILTNALLIEDAIVHYCSVWPSHHCDSAPMHGDLSVDNIIRAADGIYIIDWEHFAYDAAPFGFDAYNLLFEQLWFSLKSGMKLTKGERAVVLQNASLIRAAAKGSPGFHKRPLGAVRKIIKNSSSLWNNQVNRLPVLMYTDEQTEIVDDIVQSNASN